MPQPYSLSLFSRQSFLIYHHKKTMNSKRQKTLKPLLEVGQPVYSAYWGPADVNREETDPAWYPGVVSSYKVRKHPDDDEKYGHARYYNINFDDGDVMTDVPDHFVMAAEEYLLSERDDEDEDHSWIGVKNITDRKSNDMWAKLVGWYVTTFDEECGGHTFSLLSDALRAYDAHVVRTKGMLRVKESDLNIPEDWKELFDVQEKMTRLVQRDGKDGEKVATAAAKIREEAKEEMKVAQKKHRAEMDRLKQQLQKDHEDAKEVALREAIVKEKRAMREIHSQEKKELKAKHAEELEVLREHFQYEKEEAKNEVSAQEELSQRQKLKPLFNAGEEVVAAWWPDMSRQDTASWYPGHVKSYREVEGGIIKGNYYGPTRVYHIKYDDDGTELTDVPEQYVFPRKDYLLSTSRPINHLWKGVKNVTDDSTSDSWAKYVGWYTVDIVSTVNHERQTQLFTRLADALHAYDASIVHRKGDKTRRRDLNLPDEWEWLFNKNGIKGSKFRSFSNEDLQKEKEELKSKLEKKYEHEKEMAVNEALENEKQKIKDAQNRLRNDMKKRHKADLDKALDELKQFYMKDKAETVNSLKEWYEKDKAKAIDDLKENYEKEKNIAVESVQKVSESEKALAVEKLRGELNQQFYHEKEKAMYWLRVELKQLQQKVEEMQDEKLDQGKRAASVLKRLSSSSSSSSVTNDKEKKRAMVASVLKRLSSPSSSLTRDKEKKRAMSNISPESSPPRPAKFMKVSASSSDGKGGSAVHAAASSGNVTPSVQPRTTIVEKKSAALGCNQHALPLPPFSHNVSYSAGDQDIVLNKDQSAGEQTNEEMHRTDHQQQYQQHHHSAVTRDALAVTALLSFTGKCNWWE